MFTGIVERTGAITGTTAYAGGRRLRLDIGEVASECKLGDSICVSGVCLTVAGISGTSVEFDVIKETLDRTTLGRKPVGSRINIERSLRAGDRLDGHFVQGHVDGTAAVARVQRSSQEHVVWLTPSGELSAYIIPKGSVAIDGVSLTIAAVEKPLFSVALIPTTLERTTLGELNRGDTVNLETDIIVRTIVHSVAQIAGGAGLRLESLQKAGFA
jgi:riboflavin synthase